MKLTFQSITIVDFKSFRGRHIFDLDRRAGLYFVRGRNDRNRRMGSNGAGKSSIWDAFTWCLTGTTPAGLRNPDVKPWKGSSKPKVVVHVQCDDTPHTVARSIQPNLLRIDGRDASPEAVTKLIGMSWDVLCNTIILGQAQDLFFDRSPRDKMKLLSDVKGLERWDERSKAASDKVRKFELEHAELTGEINSIADYKKQLVDMLTELRPQAEQWQKKFEKKMYDDAIFAKRHQGELDKLQRRIDGYDLQHDSAMTEVKACQRAITYLQETISTERSNMLTVKLRRENLVEDIGRWEEEAAACKPGKACPTCGQRLKVDGGISHHRADLKRNILNAEQTLKVLKVKPIALVIEQLEKTLKREQAALDDFHKRADVALQKMHALHPRHAELKDKLATIAREKKEAETMTNPHLEHVRRMQKRLRRAKQDHEDAVADRDQCTKDIETHKFWVKGFKDIKLHVIEELLQELELATAGMLEEVGLIGWRVRYSIEHETKRGTSSRGLNVMIGSPESKGLVRWESWSGGEGQRLRVVGALALADVLLNHASVVPNIEVLDEPTQHLSDEGVHDLCAYLADRGHVMRRAIFYADQQSVESSHFAGTIIVRRDDDGTSRIVRGARAQE